jgi:hypothetical protein
MASGVAFGAARGSVGRLVINGYTFSNMAVSS